MPKMKFEKIQIFDSDEFDNPIRDKSRKSPKKKQATVNHSVNPSAPKEAIKAVKPSRSAAKKPKKAPRKRKAKSVKEIEKSTGVRLTKKEKAAIRKVRKQLRETDANFTVGTREALQSKAKGGHAGLRKALNNIMLHSSKFVYPNNIAEFIDVLEDYHKSYDRYDYPKTRALLRSLIREYKGGWRYRSRERWLYGGEDGLVVKGALLRMNLAPYTKEEADARITKDMTNEERDQWACDLIEKAIKPADIKRFR